MYPLELAKEKILKTERSLIQLNLSKPKNGKIDHNRKDLSEITHCLELP